LCAPASVETATTILGVIASSGSWGSKRFLIANAAFSFVCCIIFAVLAYLAHRKGYRGRATRFRNGSGALLLYGLLMLSRAAR
jgi:hypothetical protein